MKITKFIKTNLLISFLIVLFAFVYPFFVEKIVYVNKAQEVISISKIIEKAENLNYINKNKYISIKKGDNINLSKEFNLKINDIQYYNYSIFTTFNTYTLYAEPKIIYLKSREISPKIYVYYKKLNEKPIIKWK